MPQLRFDHTTSDWVVFAPLRKLRPHRETSAESAALERTNELLDSCPFCPGNEQMTPPEIYAIRGNSGSESDWLISYPR